MDLDTKIFMDTLGSQFDEWRKRQDEKRQNDWLSNTAEDWKVTPEQLRWLALVPSWTVGLAVLCQINGATSFNAPANLFEEKNKSHLEQMESKLGELVRRGLLNAQLMPVALPSILNDGRIHRQKIYQMNEPNRSEILAHLREKVGQSGVINQLVTYAERVLLARETVQIPENLSIWAQLARYLATPVELVKLVEDVVEQATPITLAKLEAVSQPATRAGEQSKIFSTSKLPSPSYDLPPAYFSCMEYSSPTKFRREWNAPINQSPFSIGRTMRNSLVLNDDRISRNHAYIQWRENGYYITDTNSRNGIFVQGKLLTPEVAYRLEDGQVLEIGGPNIYRLVFHFQKLATNKPNVDPTLAKNPLLPPAPEASPGSDETQLTRTVFPANRWANPLQTGPENNRETVHLPTLEANLNQALQWVETTRSLQENLDLTTRVRLDRASARLQLQFRRWDDLLQLKTFLERPAQIEVFEALLKSTDDSWALHYLGPGGYGKTTLIRYLVTRLAPARGLPVARIDFDHLDPHYPRYQPGLLLSELSEELRLQAAQAYTFSGFDQSIASFYEKYPPAEAGLNRDENQDWLNDPLFKKVLADFASALKEMGGQVLLVLDTCEELTKVRLAGQPAENVTVTFDLLERLHELEPRLRVIFSGRRLLASAGNGWEYVGGRSQPTETNSVIVEFQPPVSRLAPRPYLALFPIMGFSQVEAEAYLQAAGIDKTFWQPIIDKTMSALPQIFEQFEWNATGLLSPQTIRPLQGRDASRSSNPFDLSLYTTWVLEDPEVTPAKVVETDLQRYVETRILGRARSELSNDFLMSVALLGRFDYPLLKATLGSENEDSLNSKVYGAFDTFEAAFQALSGYEWVTHSGSGWLEIQENILTHLRHYFQVNGDEKSNIWNRLRVRAISHLDERTLMEARTGSSISAAEVALELYAQQGPSKAFEWFSRWNQAIASWDWAQLATERLLGVPLIKRPASQLLQARILVLQGAAHLHQFGATGLPELWQRTTEYVKKAEEAALLAEPDSYEQSRAFWVRLEFVRLMALVGEAAACFATGTELPEPRWTLFWQAASQLSPTRPRETGAILGALEAAVEARENEQLSRPLPLDIIEEVYHRLSRNWQWQGSPIQPRLLADFAHSLLGRAMFYEGQTKEGLKHLEKGITYRRLAGEKKTTTSGSMLDQEWLYLWEAPTDFEARLQLEWGRLVRSRLSLRMVESHLPLPEKISMPSTLDHDRLAGLQLVLSEDLRPVPDSRLPELLALLIEPPRYDIYPKVNAHRSLLPARVMAAKALSGVGRFGEAIDHLDNFITGAEERGESLASLPETQVLVELAIAARIGPNPVRRYSELLRSTDPDSQRLVWALEGLEGRRRPPISTWKYANCLPIQAHYRWRGGYALRRDHALNLCQVYSEMAALARRSELVRSPVGQVRYESDLYQLKLDDLESQLVLQRFGRLASNTAIVDPGPPEFNSNLTEIGLRLNHLLLAQARHQALTLTSTGAEIVVSNKLLERLGERNAARLLLQDGELLALRLPSQAVYLLSAARSLFQASRESDPLSTTYAGICETQALIRSGRNERARIVWREVQGSYEKFRASWPILAQTLGLPGWQALEQAQSNPANAERVLELFKRLDKNWQPWLARLLFTGVALTADSGQWLALYQTLNSIIYASA
ncbi:MAG: FHA domain-containing protein, partial [Chloroflexota bacterium]